MGLSESEFRRDIQLLAEQVGMLPGELNELVVRGHDALKDVW